MGTVGIQESSLQIHDGLASPVQYKSGFLSNNCYGNSLQVLFLCIAQKSIYILRIYYHCHTLLRLGDCQFRAIQSGIFLGYLVQIYGQTVCQLTDGNGDTAGTKVVTFFDQTADFLTTEQSLDLTLGRCITLLYLSTTGLDGSIGMYLGGSGRTAAAVTSSTSA